MASSPEELALELSQAVLASQAQTEGQLRESPKPQPSNPMPAAPPPGIIAVEIRTGK